jgi:hypothetical protein
LLLFDFLSKKSSILVTIPATFSILLPLQYLLLSN